MPPSSHCNQGREKELFKKIRKKKKKLWFESLLNLTPSLECWNSPRGDGLAGRMQVRSLRQEINLFATQLQI